MSNYDEKIARIEGLAAMLKKAFQPMPPMPAPGGAPAMDPAMMQQQGAPAMMQQQGAPAMMDPAMMDPAMAQQAGMDPAMMQQAAPAADPAQLESMMSEVMSAVEQVAGAMEQQNQTVAQLQQQLQQIQQEHMQMNAQMGMLEKALKDSMSPLEGMPQ